MAKKHKNANKPEAEAVEMVEAVEQEPVVEDVEWEEATIIEPITIPGMVIGCGKLNVRKEPKADAAIVCAIAGNTELVINVNDSTEDFYKICTASGIEGFCMKKFIEDHA